MRITPETKLGPYVVVGSIGAGGMGEVYRARDARLGRDVAIKVLPVSMAADRVALARFEREVRAVAALSHPNILAIFDIGEDAGVTYAVTELLEGDTLRQRLKTGPINVRKATEYAAQVAQGLAAAHEKGIVHRDLKPENLFVLPDGRVKILDFGLARQADTAVIAPDGATAVLATDPGIAPGTPAYMAPEQIRGEPLSPQVDIFAFGAVLFEMLGGQRAFQAATSIDTLNAVLNHEPPDLTTVDRNIPSPVAQIVRRCLEKRPGDRFQSARDLAFQLQLLAGTPTPSGTQAAIATGAPPAGTSTSASATQPAGSAHRRLVWLAASAFFVALAFAAGWHLRKPAAPPHASFVRATFTQQAVFRAMYAPEAGTFLYSASRNGNPPETYSRAATFPTSRPIGVPDSLLLSVSSKGELALLTGVRMDAPMIARGTLSRMPLGTTSPRAVVENVRDAAWSPDGSELVIVRTGDAGDSLEFPHGRALLQTTGFMTDVRISPDGDRVAFVEHPLRWQTGGSVVVVDRAGMRTVIAGPYPAVRGVVWRADGSQVAFSARTNSAALSAIYAADMRGSVQPLLQSAGDLVLHDIGPTGQWLVTRNDRRMGIRSRARGEAERELSWLDLSDLAALSEDGRAVLFTELDAPGSPGGAVCLRSTDGTPAVTLSEGRAMALSPDGLTALTLQGTPPQLILDPTGAGDDRPLPRGPIGEFVSAAWFPDGQRVLVCGSPKSGMPRCFAQDTNGGDPRPVTDSGTWGAVSPDGRRILVRRPGQPPAVYAADGGAAVPVPGTTAADVPARWTPDGASVLVYNPGPASGRVDRIHLATGQRENVTTTAPADAGGLLAIAPVLFTPDLSAYAFGYARVLSTVYTVDGLNWK